MQADAKLDPVVPQFLMPDLQNEGIQPNMLSQPSQVWQQVRIWRMHLSPWRMLILPQTLLMPENACLSYVAPQFDLQAVYPAPVDIPAGPQPPFHDCPSVRRISSEVPITTTFTNTNVDSHNTGRVQPTTI